MSIEVSGVTPSWTSSTSAASPPDTNAIHQLPFQPTKKKNSSSAPEVVAVTDVDVTFPPSIASYEDDDCDEEVGSDGESSSQNHALPPLPDLIPIRKSLHSANGIESISNSSSSSSNNGTSSQIKLKIKNKSQLSVIVTNAAVGGVSNADNVNEHSTASTNIIAEDNHQDETTAKMATNKSNQRGRKIKTEVEDATELSVPHRKSDRRRVARDIFFLFEEVPAARKRCSIGRGRGRGATRARGRPTKPKFAHLSASVDVKPVMKAPKQAPPTPAPPPTPTASTPAPPTPRVNPIFLWVKQDDTRIVEVRCEDYDKRNRIKLTKTANGWRAIPRTDPTSSRVAKLLPNPLVKIKQEICDQNESMELQLPAKKDKKKKKKKRKKKRKEAADEDDVMVVVEEVDEKASASSPVIISSPAAAIADVDGLVYEHDPHANATTILQNLAPHVELLDDLTLVVEPNNNEPSDELSKNLTQISDEIDDMDDMDDMPPYLHQIPADIQLCPQTGLFINSNGEALHHSPHITPDPTDVETPPNIDSVVLDDDDFDNSAADTKHLKDLLDDADLLQHCSGEIAMSGAELIESLMKRGCEDNHISGEEDQHHHHHPKDTICLDDFDNEEDDILMQPQPVEDIISRLGESLTASPKVLSFNEAGDIEGMHGELFRTATQSDTFNCPTLEELSITIKDLEKSSSASSTASETNFREPSKATATTIVSPDSCADELPKDLTCKKSGAPPSQEDRPQSRSSDAIQSPQPSGLPAVPPSPDIVHYAKASNKSLFLDQLLNSSSISPKLCSSVTVTPIKIPSATQKEPLDLGKHRKSASPTVSCSEEANQSDEPMEKRLKTANGKESDKTHTENLIEMLATGKDPNPLTQLRLLIRNPEWKVPDPILVPKDRLSAVLASPAREIPLLLTTRPELRLPEAFAYPSILKDPDILVISMAQLEAILQKQIEIERPKAKTPPVPQVTIEPVKARPDASKTPKSSQMNPMAPLLGSGLATDIDAATLAAFNQMLWLPYLGQIAPDFLKAMSGLPSTPNLVELLPLLAQQQQHQPKPFNTMAVAAAAAAGLGNPMGFQNPLEFAMWQEAINQAQFQRALKLNAAAQTQKKNAEAKAATSRMAAMLAAGSTQSGAPSQKQMDDINQYLYDCSRMQSSAGSSKVASHEKSSTTRSVLNPFYRPPGHGNNNIDDGGQSRKNRQQQVEQKPRVTCKSLSNLLQPDRLTANSTDAKMSNLMTMPGFDCNMNQSSASGVGSMNVFGYSRGGSGGVPSSTPPASSHHHHNSLHSNHTRSNHQNQNSSNQVQQVQAKLKVKPGSHLLDPAALQRRLLNNDDASEVGSTTSGLDEMMAADPNAALWHPLFGNTQKTGYNSPWQWTTVTASGE